MFKSGEIVCIPLYPRRVIKVGSGSLRRLAFGANPSPVAPNRQSVQVQHYRGSVFGEGTKILLPLLHAGAPQLLWVFIVVFFSAGRLPFQERPSDEATARRLRRVVQIQPNTRVRPQLSGKLQIVLMQGSSPFDPPGVRHLSRASCDRLHPCRVHFRKLFTCGRPAVLFSKATEAAAAAAAAFLIDDDSQFEDCTLLFAGCRV